LEFKIGPSFYQNKTNNKENEIFYNEKYNGFINLTSIYQAPLFISKAHMLDADDYMRTAITY
jgi:CTP:phosphocholine cytidylyltransferase-like protein